jgi:hypothetical protein
MRPAGFVLARRMNKTAIAVSSVRLFRRAPTKDFESGVLLRGSDTKTTITRAETPSRIPLLVDYFGTR